MASSRKVELFDRSMTIAAQVFTSVLPILIALASWFGWTSADLAGLLVVPPEASALVEDSISTTSAATFGTVGVLLVILSATSLSRALTRACAAQWDLERPAYRLAAAWRWVAAVLAVVVSLLAAKPLNRLAIDLPPPALWQSLVGVLPDIAIALFLPAVLLAGDVRVRLLVPGALVFGAVMLIIRPVSTDYLPQALQASASRYGSLGVAFAYLAWLYVVAFCFLLSGIVGRVTAADPGRLGRWIRGEQAPEKVMAISADHFPPNVS
jgi:membrane protein